MRVHLRDSFLSVLAASPAYLLGSSDNDKVVALEEQLFCGTSPLGTSVARMYTTEETDK